MIVDVNELWRFFWSALDPDDKTAARNQLVMHYLPNVERIAPSIKRRLPPSVDVEDVLADARLGLIQAVDRFDLGRGATFETYCDYRIRGAILDALRSDDWVPRRVRKNGLRITKAQSELRRELGRDPSDRELADRLKVSLDGLGALTRESRIKRILQTSRVADKEGDFNHPGADLLERADPESGRGFALVDARDALESFLECLSPRERRVVLLRSEGSTFPEIAAKLDRTPSRANQLYHAAIKKIRRHHDWRAR